MCEVEVSDVHEVFDDVESGWRIWECVRQCWPISVKGGCGDVRTLGIREPVAVLEGLHTVNLIAET